MWELLSAGLAAPVFWGLVGASFLGSFMTAALGIGGGAFLLAVMASLLPAQALIPVHGVVQLGSNLFRAIVFARHAYLGPVPAFGAGTVLGAVAGGAVAVDLPAGVVQAGVGLFVIWSILARPPGWLARAPALTGLFSSFLTMFFGATGPFVVTYVKSLDLPRQPHVATHAVLMTMQHLLKIAVFGGLGFAFGPWLGFSAAMIGAGVLGTLAGRSVLHRMSDMGFRRALNAILLLLALRLIWNGLSG